MPMSKTQEFPWRIHYLKVWKDKTPSISIKSHELSRSGQTIIGCFFCILRKFNHVKGLKYKKHLGFRRMDLATGYGFSCTMKEQDI
ncbi:hypothetical protein GCM10007216_00060 [Thalassobacillus devorans]|uniref:Uncharacterized protein n=1 Tax=Thalassobacillus devorans TaxID=279813 RepID=A0ABQ1NDL2_9BACI|nr:hypothetical protein GCM10007216_00060 [Thalassobacillus devorans]